MDPSDQIAESILEYSRIRARMRMFTAVHDELAARGISYEVVAQRLGKDVDYIETLLGSPGSWTLDTISDLLIATSGGEAMMDVINRTPLEFDSGF